MSEDAIIDAYQLRDINVSPDELLLDPENPRIVLKIDRAADYTLQELTSPEIQKYIFSVVDKAEFHVADLVESIGHSGFLDHGNRMILERVDGTRKYLVLEGNRRLTAIKQILNNPSNYSPRVLESLRSIKAHELVLTDTSVYDRNQVKSKLLGLIHLKGPLQWGAMERAYYIYQIYSHELKKEWENFEEPFYDFNCCRSCGETFEMGPLEIRNELAVYLVYHQLREEGYQAREDHYSLIGLAVRAKGMNRDYFELDWDTFRLSFVGLERFNNLCIDEDGPIHNPGDFKKMANVWKEAGERYVEFIENGASSLDDVVDMVNTRMAKRQFLTQVKKIEHKMSSLRLIEPVGLKSEVELVTRIRDIANQILRSFR